MKRSRSTAPRAVKGPKVNIKTKTPSSKVGPSHESVLPLFWNPTGPVSEPCVIFSELERQREFRLQRWRLLLALREAQIPWNGCWHSMTVSEWIEHVIQAMEEIYSAHPRELGMQRYQLLATVLAANGARLCLVPPGLMPILPTKQLWSLEPIYSALALHRQSQVPRPDTARNAKKGTDTLQDHRKDSDELSSSTSTTTSTQPDWTHAAYWCSKCRTQSAVSAYQLQTRSADEPMTTYTRCLRCGSMGRIM